MLALTLYMALTVTMRTKDRALAAVAPVRTALLAADLVRQDLEAVLPCNQLFSGAFVGTPQSGADILDFYCLGNDAGWHQTPVVEQGKIGGGGAATGAVDVPWSEGPRHVVLSLRSDTQPPSLVRSVTRNLLAPTVPAPDDEILCRNVKSFTLEYLDTTGWLEQWDSTTVGDVLPMAVRMTMEVIIDDPKPGQQPTVYKVVRVFPLACSKPTTDAQTGTTP
jgi:hypothetical protein